MGTREKALTENQIRHQNGWSEALTRVQIPTGASIEFLVRGQPRNRGSIPREGKYGGQVIRVTRARPVREKRGVL